MKEVRADAAILTEPTACKVCVAHKGFAWLTITTHGFAMHGSLYTEGIDAVAHMGRVLTTLEALERDSLPQRNHPLLGRPSVHASLINGGLGLSTYPDLCQLQIEHRLLPDETGDQVLQLWNETLQRLNEADPLFRADVTLDFFRPGLEVERDASIVQTLHNTMVNVMGKEPEYFGMWSWMDSAILGRAGIPRSF